MKEDILALAAELGVNPPNDDQIKAIDTLDGPVLVIAGPGTGKTQLLGLRTVNLLRNRDIRPKNVLCLTFTEAGATAMTKRLVDFIGRDAYEVHISTFHGFAESVRAEFPQYFNHGALSTVITPLQISRKLSELLHKLHYQDPLAQNVPFGKHGHIKSMLTFISNLQRSGISAEQLKSIVEQNLAFFEYVATQTNILSSLDAPKGNSEQKAETLDKLEATIVALPALAPKQITARLTSLPGVYQPYAQYLAETFSNTTLYENGGKSTKGFQELREKLFEGKSEQRIFKDEKVCRQALSALALYEQYRNYLDENNLYNFDDMILDTLHAIESHADLKTALQERYRYIQLDEFQDTNGSQMRLVELLTDYSSNPNLLVVGDDDQAIYRFQGASVTYIKEFESAYPQVTRCVLKTNYRSTPSLVKLGQNVAQQIEFRSEASATEKVLTAFKQEARPRHFTITNYPDAELQYFKVAESIKQRIDAGFIQNSKNPHEAIAVIARGHKSLQGVMPYLKTNGIPFNYTYTTSVANVASLQSLLALLNFIACYAKAQPSYAEPLLPQILQSPELGFAALDYVGFALEANRLDVPLAQRDMRWMEALKLTQKANLKHFYPWLLELIQMAATSPVRKTILAAAQPFRAYYQRNAETDPYVLLEFNKGLDALISFFEDELNATKRCLSDPPLRLFDLTLLFKEATAFDIPIEVSLSINREAAVQLTTAHSSKGLEYDAVYLIDADDAAWHRKGSKGTSFLCRNLEFSEESDEDDDRRLLFVALTRARDELEITRAAKNTVRELLDLLDEEEASVGINEAVMQSELIWEDSYKLDSDELLALAKDDLKNSKLSVSRLNQFVQYRPGCSNTSDYVTSTLLGFPHEPNIYLAFGNAFHEFAEEYLNHVVVAGDKTADSLAARTREKIARLDFEKSDLEHMLQRFEHILDKFMPTLSNYLSSNIAVERWIRADLDNIPLVGKCDLMVLDNESKTMTLYDFKTNGSIPKSLDANYMRQLQFYRYVIENSSEFVGWRVTRAADLYVQPIKELGYQLAPPEYHTVTDQELDQLKLLIKAVWWRIQNGLFDTTAFEKTPLYHSVKPSAYKADGDLLAKDAQSVQEAYEQWLIDEWLKHTHPICVQAERV